MFLSMEFKIKKTLIDIFPFSPLAVHQLFWRISCRDYAGNRQCQYVEAESFDLASKSFHFPQSRA